MRVCCNNDQQVLETYTTRENSLWGVCSASFLIMALMVLSLFFHRDWVTFGDDSSLNVWKKMCVDRRAFSISNRWPPNEQPHSQQMRDEQNPVNSRTWSQQDHQMSQQATALPFHSPGVLYPKEKRWDEESLQVNAGGDPKPPVHRERITVVTRFYGNKEGWLVTSD